MQQQQNFHPRGGYNRGRDRGNGGYQFLPLGWEQARTPEGQIYYIDHNTRTTHWDAPTQFAIGGRGRGIDTTKRKTKMCANFELGQCRWGTNCAFAHNASELVSGIDIK